MLFIKTVILPTHNIRIVFQGVNLSQIFVDRILFQLTCVSSVDKHVPQVYKYVFPIYIYYYGKRKKIIRNETGNLFDLLIMKYVFSPELLALHDKITLHLLHITQSKTILLYLHIQRNLHDIYNNSKISIGCFL